MAANTSAIVNALESYGFDGLPSARPEFVPEQEWDILVDRMSGMTLQEIAERLGTTRERIRQREAKALRRFGRNRIVKAGGTNP